MDSEATELLDRSARADAEGPDLEAGESARETSLRHRGITDSDTTRSEELDNHAAGSERRYDELLSLGSYKSSFWVILTRSWANIGLLFVPVAFILHDLLPDSVILIVIINFIAICALSGLLDFTSTQVALRVGGFAERIIYDFQKNLVEIIFAIIALRDCELQTLQALLMGSMISNLLVVGICFQLGGLRYFEQGFDKSKAQVNCSLLMLGATTQILPGVMKFTTSNVSDLDPYSGVPFGVKSIARMSRAIAILLFLFYCCYLLSEFFSHRVTTTEEFKSLHTRTNTSINYPQGSSPGVLIGSVFSRAQKNINAEETPLEASQPDHETMSLLKKPTVNLVVAVVSLVVSTVLLVFTTQYLWEGLDTLMWDSEKQQYRISPKFVGIIMIQLVTNMAQAVIFIEAMNESLQDRLDGIIDTMIGGSIQMALFITPLLVVIGWIMGIPLLLINDPLDCTILLLSVLVLNYVVNDGRSNWIEGVILLTLYIIFAISLWHYPGRNLYRELEEMGPLPKVCNIDGNS